MLVRVYEHEIVIRDLHTVAVIRRQTRARRKRAVQIGPKTDALCRELLEQRGREAHKSMCDASTRFQ